MDYAELWVETLNASYSKYDYIQTLDTLPVKVMQHYSRQLSALLSNFRMQNKKLKALNLMFGKQGDRQVRYFLQLTYADMMTILAFFYDEDMKIRPDRVEWLQTWITKKLQNVD